MRSLVSVTASFIRFQTPALALGLACPCGTAHWAVRRFCLLTWAPHFSCLWPWSAVDGCWLLAVGCWLCGGKCCPKRYAAVIVAESDVLKIYWIYFHELLSELACEMRIELHLSLPSQPIFSCISLSICNEICVCMCVCICLCVWMWLMRLSGDF